VIDSQSAETTESGGPRGYAAEKMIKGRKRHLLTDTIGLPVGMIVNPANVQDRDAAPELPASLGSAFPWLHHIFADGGYAGPKLQDALKNFGATLEIVKHLTLEAHSKRNFCVHRDCGRFLDMLPAAAA
jgi:putative transposase